MKNYRRNNYIGKMKKGFKQKLSLLMIACLLFTGYRGLTISGRADSSHTEQNNKIEVSGTQVKVQLLGADLRRAATEAILKGEKVGKSNLRSYSKDQELATEFEEYFDGEKEIYNIPLNSIAENLEESLNAEEAGLQIYVERDAKNLDRLVRKESKESLLLYSKESAVAGLLPKKEEATTVSLTEEKASDSNLERNTELTGSELITFVYENKSTERMTFQLSVDGNKYPKVTVASKTSLFKQFLGDAKKAQAEARNAKATEAKAESTEAQTVEASKAEVSSTEAKQEVAGSKATAETKSTEESKASEEARKDDSEVAIVSTAAEATEAVAESTEARAEVKTEASEEATEAKAETTEAEVKETTAKAETAQAEKATEEQKAVVEDSSLLKDITEHSEEILPELQSIRFTQYSLNELGRKSQNVEIEGFGNVQVFYDEAAFDGDVVLEAKRLFKPEEEAEGEKLSEEQVKILKDEALYDDSASLDIRFVDKKDSTVEVEPKSPVAVRITIEKKALPEEAKAEDISIHHIVEEEGTEKPISVETVSRSDNEKKTEKNNLTEEIDNAEKIEETTVSKEEELSDKISKEFTVTSFSAYVVTWKIAGNKPIRFHFVDENYHEIAPTKFIYNNWLATVGKEVTVFKHNNGKAEFIWSAEGKFPWNINTKIYANHELLQFFYGYQFKRMDALADNDKGQFDRTNQVVELTNKGVLLSGSRAKTYFNKNQIRDFYLVYNFKQTDQCGAYTKFQYSQPDLRNEKYITKHCDGTYDLTLTAQTKPGTITEKPKLELLFIYDNTGNIKPEDAKKAKDKMIEIMNTLSSEKSGYDARFALISMNSEKNPDYNRNELKRYNNDAQKDALNVNNTKILGLSPIVGTLGDLNRENISNTYKVQDEKYNDVRTYEFSDKKTIENEINTMPSAPSVGTGANFEAAIMDARSLMNWATKDDDPLYNAKTKTNEWGNFQVYERYDGVNRLENPPYEVKSRNANLHYSDIRNLARKEGNVKNVVVLIAGGNPSKVYAPEDGVYEDYVKEGEEYYITRAEYKKGQSIGTLGKINYSAYNSLKSLLRNFHSLDSFYTVGVGDESNWSTLKEFDKYLPRGIEVKNFSATNIQRLDQQFSYLLSEITDTSVHDIQINDELSENVELVNGQSSLRGELVKMKDNNVETDYILTDEQRKAMGLSDIKVTVAPNGKTLTLKTVPESFVLPTGYELRLVATIKPTKEAFDKVARNEDNDTGDKRTDLDDIYATYLGQDKKTGRPDIYGSSAGKRGLYTNVEDKTIVTGKYKNKNYPNCPYCQTIKKKYNKPIISTRGYLKVYKIITGFDNKLINDSTGRWTDLAKLVLDKIQFKIYRSDNPNKPILTINLGDMRWFNNPEVLRSGKSFIIDGYKVTIKPAEKNMNSGKVIEGQKFVFEINDLPTNYEYRIVEEVLEPDTIFKENPSDLIGYKFGDKVIGEKTEQFNKIPAKEGQNPCDGNVYHFTNVYRPAEDPKTDVTIKKIVRESNGTEIKKGAQDEDKYFDFYLGLFTEETINKVKKRKSYTEAELNKVVEEYNKVPGIKKTLEVVYLEDIEVDPETKDLFDDALEKSHYVIHFKLKHDEKITLPLENGTTYRVYEKQEDGYKKPKYSITENKKGTEKFCTVIKSNGLWYACTASKVVTNTTVTLYNQKINIVLTGLVNDFTPYIWGLFGFVAMAGAYLTISKKRREV